MERAEAKGSRTGGWRSALLFAGIPLVGLVGLRDEKPTLPPGGDPAGEMVLIPAGEFLMGSNTEGDHAPAHRVRVDAFYLDIHEVTNGEYLEFCEATGHRLPEFWGIEARRSGIEFPNHPVAGWKGRTFRQGTPCVLPTPTTWSPGSEVQWRCGVILRTDSVSTICPGTSSSGSQTAMGRSIMPRAPRRIPAARKRGGSG